jgi:hypothetical protein
MEFPNAITFYPHMGLLSSSLAHIFIDSFEIDKLQLGQELRLWQSG